MFRVQFDAVRGGTARRGNGGCRRVITGVITGILGGFITRVITRFITAFDSVEGRWARGSLMDSKRMESCSVRSASVLDPVGIAARFGTTTDCPPPYEFIQYTTIVSICIVTATTATGDDNTDYKNITVRNRSPGYRTSGLCLKFSERIYTIKRFCNKGTRVLLPGLTRSGRRLGWWQRRVTLRQTRATSSWSRLLVTPVMTASTCAGKRSTRIYEGILLCESLSGVSKRSASVGERQCWYLLF